MHQVTFLISARPPGCAFQLWLHFSYLWTGCQKNAPRIFDMSCINKFWWHLASCIACILNIPMITNKNRGRLKIIPKYWLYIKNSKGINNALCTVHLLTSSLFYTKHSRTHILICHKFTHVLTYSYADKYTNVQYSRSTKWKQQGYPYVFPKNLLVSLLVSVRL